MGISEQAWGQFKIDKVALVATEDTPFSSNSKSVLLPLPSYILKMPLKVIVVGAGLGGLGAAIALNRSGHDVQVCLALATCSRFVNSCGTLGYRAIRIPQ